MRFAGFLTGLLSLLMLCTLASAGTIEKKYPDGTLKVRYVINDVGAKDGLYEEFFPSGKLKVKADYRQDKLDGSYVEMDEKGRKVLTAAYQAGKLHGRLSRYSDGQPSLTQEFKQGVLVHPRSREEIKKQLAAIQKIPAGTDADVAGALRRLMAYRYLADLPHANLVLDAEVVKKAQAAAKISEKNGKIDHQPKNPGLPEEEYKFAFESAKTSLLAGGIPLLSKAVDIWMFDSDARNLQRLGHRRWCLNPKLQKVGFGKAGLFSAIAPTDESNASFTDFDTICFPARGLMPVEYFSPQHAWTVSLNPSRFAPPGKDAAARIVPVDATLKQTSPPLKLNFALNVGKSPFEKPIPCAIFRPEKIDLAPGKRYLVEIDGLKKSDGKTPAPVAYVVEFTNLK